MTNTDYRSVDDYIASRPSDTQPILQRVRATLRKAMPGAEEVISYQIPAYRMHGGVVLCFAGWKQHFSIYPVTEPLAEAFGEELAPYRASKGTLRFPLDQAVPVKLIERIAKFRADEQAERAAARVATTVAAGKKR